MKSKPAETSPKRTRRGRSESARLTLLHVYGDGNTSLQLPSPNLPSWKDDGGRVLLPANDFAELAHDTAIERAKLRVVDTERELTRICGNAWL